MKTRAHQSIATKEPAVASSSTLKIPNKIKGEKIMTNRKTLAALVVATMLATLIAFTGTRAEMLTPEGEGGPALEGSWEVTVMPDGGAPIVDVATFTGGGELSTLILIPI